jgi:hypothetical protein
LPDVLRNPRESRPPYGAEAPWGADASGVAVVAGATDVALSLGEYATKEPTRSRSILALRVVVPARFVA